MTETLSDDKNKGTNFSFEKVYLQKDKEGRIKFLIFLRAIYPTNERKLASEGVSPLFSWPFF
jgi:hypothetical protein